MSDKAFTVVKEEIKQDGTIHVELKHEKSPRIAVRVSQKLRDELQEEADKRGKTISYIVRERLEKR